MVKGTTRRVVVIKSPDPRVFDEAIFIVRDEAASRGVTGAEILSEAQLIAQQYIERNKPQRNRLAVRLKPHVCAVLGAGFTAILWILSAVLF